MTNVSKDHRLLRSRRVRKRADFMRIQGSKRKARMNNLLVALATPFKESNPDSRLGITVTTKVDKRAVKRNKFKRRVREFFRKERQYFQEKVDIVVIALDGACELSYRELVWQLRGALLKARVLKHRERKT